MSQPSLHHLSCPDDQRGHRMAWWQWGDVGSAHVVVCVHGLTRQGRDFDVLAGALVAAAQARGQRLLVVCPDVAGRGQSDWLPDPAGYQLPTYAADLLQLLGHLAQQVPERRFDWVGTSMGGLILLAALPGLEQGPGQGVSGGRPRLCRTVFNDVGPALEWPALQRIASYVGAPGVRFTSVSEGARYLRGLLPGFGPHSEAEWLALSAPMLAPVDAQHWRLHYDPAIAQAFRPLDAGASMQAEQQLWTLYDGLQGPSLLLRGAQSDLLARPAALEMARRGPCPRLIEFDAVGHAPTLVACDQVAAVVPFLLND